MAVTVCACRRDHLLQSQGRPRFVRQASQSDATFRRRPGSAWHAAATTPIGQQRQRSLRGPTSVASACSNPSWEWPSGTSREPERRQQRRDQPAVDAAPAPRRWPSGTSLSCGTLTASPSPQPCSVAPTAQLQPSKCSSRSQQPHQQARNTTGWPLASRPVRAVHAGHCAVGGVPEGVAFVRATCVAGWRAGKRGLTTPSVCFCVQARPSPLNTAGGSCFTWRRARPKGTPPRGAWHPALGGAHLLARSDVCGIRGRWCVDAHGYQEPIAPLITEERQRLKKLSSYRRPRPSPAAASPSRGPRDPPTSSSGRRRAPVASSGSFASGGVSETLRQARTAPLSGSAAGRSGSRNSRHNTTRPDVGGGESAQPPVAVRDAFTTPAPQPSPSQGQPAAQAVSSPPGQPQQQPQQQQQQQQRQQPSATARAAARASARRRRTGGAAKTKPSSTPDVAPTPPTKRGRERDRGGRTSHGASAAVGGQEAQAAGTPKAGAPRRAGRNVGASGDAAAEPRAGASRRSRAAKTSSDGRGGDGDRRSNRGRRNEGKATKRGGGARRGKGAPSGRSGNNAPDAETMRAERLAYFDKLLASQS